MQWGNLPPVVAMVYLLVCHMTIILLDISSLNWSIMKIDRLKLSAIKSILHFRGDESTMFCLFELSSGLT